MHYALLFQWVFYLVPLQRNISLMLKRTGISNIGESADGVSAYFSYELRAKSSRWHARPCTKQSWKGQSSFENINWFTRYLLFLTIQWSSVFLLFFLPLYLLIFSCFFPDFGFVSDAIARAWRFLIKDDAVSIFFLN